MPWRGAFGIRAGTLPSLRACEGVSASMVSAISCCSQSSRVPEGPDRPALHRSGTNGATRAPTSDDECGGHGGTPAAVSGGELLRRAAFPICGFGRRTRPSSPSRCRGPDAANTLRNAWRGSFMVWRSTAAAIVADRGWPSMRASSPIMPSAGDPCTRPADDPRLPAENHVESVALFAGLNHDLPLAKLADPGGATATRRSWHFVSPAKIGTEPSTFAQSFAVGWFQARS